MIAFLATFVAVAGALYVGFRLRVGDLEDRLVRDANSIVGAPKTRPLHVDRGEPGSLGQALGKHLPSLGRARKTDANDESSTAALREVLGGERPLSDLPNCYSRVLIELKDDLDGVLLATHAESADLASADDAFDPAPGVSWLDYQFGAWLTGIRVRKSLAEGNTAEAARDCLDGLALARDSAVSGGLIGHLIGVLIIERLGPACAAALAALPENQRPDSMARLRQVRNAVPGFEVTMREEAVQVQLSFLGPQLGESFRSRLRDRPKLMAKGWGNPVMDEKTWGRRLLNRALWRDRQAIYDRLVTNAALRGPERDAAFEAHAAEVGGRLLVASELPKPADYLRYAQRAEVGTLRLDLIVIAGAAKSFRAAYGVWPASVSALANEGFLTSEEVLRDARVQLEPGAGGRLDIVLPLQPELEGAPKEARLNLEAQ
ncbi:MAG: hypothetical protein HY901_08310 [Deltaproteobacteria bacterium]|nr:hypothetical protein [Deltaproteobacteria bacterium]